MLASMNLIMREANQQTEFTQVENWINFEYALLTMIRGKCSTSLQSQKKTNLSQLNDAIDVLNLSNLSLLMVNIDGNVGEFLYIKLLFTN